VKESILGKWAQIKNKIKILPQSIRLDYNWHPRSKISFSIDG